MARLYYETVRRVNVADDSTAQIEACAPEVFSASYWAERLASYRVFVAARDGCIAGFTEFDPNGHIDCF